MQENMNTSSAMQHPTFSERLAARKAVLSSSKPRFPRAAALAVAREMCHVLDSVTRKLIVAGSLRRRKSEVGDVEILYIARTEKRKIDLFRDGDADLAGELLQAMLADGILAPRPNISGSTIWGERNKLAIHKATGIPIDFFATNETSWYNYLVCRTGPAALNTRIAGGTQAQGYQWNPYGSGFTCLKTGKIIPMRTEEEVFHFAGLPYQEPWER